MNQKKVIIAAVVAVGVLVFWSQIARLLTFFRNRLTGAVVNKDVIKQVAGESGVSAGTVSATVRQSYCKGVASALFGYLHEKPLGFLPRGWFGSTEDESAIVKELNSLKNANEARYVSAYYYEKYKTRLKGLLVKYLSSSDLSDIRSEIKNNLS